MKKVMCISSGKQIEGLQVVVGNFYTVMGTVDGGECGMYHRPNDIFYLLVEMGNERVFWEGLFAELEENELAQTETRNDITDKNYFEPID